jgi:hypothetical protein
MLLSKAEAYPLRPQQPDGFVKYLERAGPIPPAPEGLVLDLSYQKFVDPINTLSKTIKSERECIHHAQ